MFIDYSPVMDFEEAVDFIAGKIMDYNDYKPYLVVINGIPSIGKTKFGRDIVGKILLRRKGMLTEPHKLERTVRQNPQLDYCLIENHEVRSLVMDLKTERYFEKKPDLGIFMLKDLARVIEPPILTLDNLLEHYDLIVENKGCPFY